LTTLQRTALQNVARNRFYEERHQQSPRRIKLAFHAGYTALDLLDGSAAGDAQSTARILEYLSAVPERLTKPPEKKVKRKREYEHDDRDPPPLYKFLNVFPRPLGSVDGIRKIPHLIDANGFPFVRWKKPQPRSVSRVLRQNIEQRQTRMDLLANLNEFWIPLSQYEDKWDEMVKKRAEEEGKVDGVEQDKVLFATAMREELYSVLQLMREKSQRARALAEKMQAIVDREVELAREERRQREGLLLDHKSEENEGEERVKLEA
jgi:hypothetical protein